MTRYAVNMLLGSYTLEVEAANEDAAINAAIATWLATAPELICEGTFDARVVGEPERTKP